jgi:hypothetical protein
VGVHEEQFEGTERTSPPDSSYERFTGKEESVASFEMQERTGLAATQVVQQVLQGISINAVELQGNRTEDPCVLEACNQQQQQTRSERSVRATHREQ